MYNSLKNQGVVLVETNEAKELVTLAYNSMMDTLEKQDTYTAECIIEHLHTLAKQLQTNSSQPLDLHSTEQNFEKEYKSLAKESLQSYAQTTNCMERINKKQEKNLEEKRNNKALEVNDIMDDFANAHKEISLQMTQAHQTIEDLNKQILSLERTSSLDPLTKTYNRRSLDKYLGDLCKMDKRLPQTTILLIDIDNFKKVNDDYGHLAGDKVLIFLAKFAKSTLREGDKVFRFGGEEFLILLNRCNKKAAAHIANRIIQGVKDNTLLYKNDSIKITLSIGSAELNENDNFDSFVDRADKALYKAKHNGKDQFVAG